MESSSRESAANHDGDNETAILNPNHECKEPKYSVSSVSSKTRSSQWARWRVALGLQSILILVIGSTVILAACAILVYLWVETYSVVAGHDASPLWNYIVRQGAAPQVVTVCAAAIRTSMTFQLGLVTAALAAVMIERSGTSLADAAMVSIKRASGSGPLDLVTAGGAREALGRHRLGPTLLATWTVLLVVTTALLSTILLSDFTDTVIPGPAVPMEIPVHAQFDMFTSLEDEFLSAGQWKSKPVSAWRFAELDRHDGNDVDTTGDTGSRILAMLPFSDEASRTDLMQYKGPASVLDTRTICYAPGVDELPDLGVYKANGNDLWAFNGTLKMRSVAGMTDDLLYEPLEGEPYEKYELPTQNFQAGLIRSTNTSAWPLFLSPAQIYYTSPTDERFSKYTMLFVVTNSTGLQTMDWVKAVEKTDWHNVNLEARNDNKQGVWTSVWDRDSAQDLFKVSVCLHSVVTMMYNVSMKGSPITQEPRPTWHLSSPPLTENPLIGAGGWNTEPLSRQMAGLGSDGLPQSLEERGLLRLEVQNLTKLDFANTQSFVFESGHYENMADGKGFSAINATSELWKASKWTPHSLYFSEFQDVVLRTGRLPLALQSFFTRQRQAWYYNNLEATGSAESITAIFATTKLLPTTSTGLYIALGVVACHFALVTLTMWLFCTRTEGSVLWESWQAVAQTVSPATQAMWDVMYGRDSREAEETIRQSRISPETYRLQYSDTTGRHQLDVSSRQRRGWLGGSRA
ncbi:hypothetical protein Cob_v010596 [Colletotrichum orbiculare MAFF 240422]|uniref:Uncharacterized protein n=1 Tax=Colletotrichum orbiculare (strain 104-T / ATCC 96160 / CBS 514.97 / LARS 414 / MAFF 240422) TaxID=1213857 RepID=N4VFV7_COLOR|nr:hypothetical protein Cob_v010596 [Colletotrichum orbiculare MAFF 240422]